MGKKWNVFQNRLQNVKKDQFFIFLLCGILLAVIFLPTDSDGEKRQQEQDEILAQEQLADSREKRLQEVLSQVEGVGKTEVMITYYSSGEKIVEKDIPLTDRTSDESDGQGGSSSSSQREAGEETVYEKNSDGSETPYVIQVTEPEIAGVLIVAEGGDNAVTVKNITEAVVALFGVEAHKIKVMKMN